MVGVGNARRNNRVIVIAEIKLIMTPSPNVNAKPLINELPKKNRMNAIIILEMFASRIEVQARSKPTLNASPIARPRIHSSRARSKIKILASTAIPIEIINPAIPAADNVTGISLYKVRVITV